MLYTDLHYFGCLSYYRELAQQEHIVFDTTAAFTKMSFKNRMVIASAQGPLQLSIPIVGGRDQKNPMSEIRIAYDSPWKAQHFKSIYSNYKRAPYFEYYVDSLSQLYKDEYVYLNDFLLATQTWTKQQLKAKWIIETTEQHPSLTKEQKWIDPMKPNNFQTSVHPFHYQQVFDATTGFIQNTAVIDAIFAMGGKQTLALLT